jgi:SEC-C motif domain protein
VPPTCPCGLPQPYDACCGRYHRGEGAPPTAELLMRSRYAAFAVGDAAYLLATWHPSTRPRRLRLDAGDCWTRLDVLGGTGGGLLHTEGTVEFRAHRRRGGGPDAQADVQHENSRFVREAGRWSYVGPA